MRSCVSPESATDQAARAALAEAASLVQALKLFGREEVHGQHGTED